jgi:hypothetical protein
MQTSLNTTVPPAALQAGFNRVFESRRAECGRHLNEQLSKTEVQEENAIIAGQKDTCYDVSARLLPAAEKELSAFVRAVTELFGFEQAQESINDWIEEVAIVDWSNGQPSPDWRAVTIAAAARLAAHL